MGKIEKDRGKKKKVTSRLKKRFRLVIINDNTFEEKFSYKLTGYNVLITLSGIAVLLIFIGIILVTFTPLKHFIPEYPDAEFHQKMIQNTLRLDSIKYEIAIRDQYIQNLGKIITGNVKTRVDDVEDTVKLHEDIDFAPSKYDSVLRRRVELEQQMSLYGTQSQTQTDNIESVRFFPPVKGIISNHFNYAEGHFGVDLVTEKSSPVYAVLPGTVISSAWSLHTGFTIQVQHQNNLVSVYKHNAELLLHEGDLVDVGQAIAFVGNTGELTTGPHLHFELWHNGLPVNPENYIEFN